MKKKKYVVPSMRLVNVEVQSILNSSDTTTVRGNIKGEEHGLEYAGDTESETTYEPW